MRLSEIRTECVINFVMNVPAWVSELRGRPYFAWLGVEYARVGSPAVVNMSPNVWFSREVPSLIFLIMPTMLDAEKLIDEAARRGSPTIVDVTGDVLGLLDDDQVDPLMRIADLERRRTHSEDVDPTFDERATLARCIHTARVITTSWPQLVGPLRAMVGHEDVYHVADTHGEQDSERFDRELGRAVDVVAEWLVP